MKRSTEMKIASVAEAGIACRVVLVTSLAVIAAIATLYIAMPPLAFGGYNTIESDLIETPEIDSNEKSVAKIAVIENHSNDQDAYSRNAPGASGIKSAGRIYQVDCASSDSSSELYSSNQKTAENNAASSAVSNAANNSASFVAPILNLVVNEFVETSEGISLTTSTITTFTFKLTGVDEFSKTATVSGAVVGDAGATKTVNVDANSTIPGTYSTSSNLSSALGTIAFPSVGTYQFALAETVSSKAYADNASKGASVRWLTVVVDSTGAISQVTWDNMENGSCTIAAEGNSSTATANFYNIYSVPAVDVTLVQVQWSQNHGYYEPFVGAEFLFYKYVGSTELNSSNFNEIASEKSTSIWQPITSIDGATSASGDPVIYTSDSSGTLMNGANLPRLLPGVYYLMKDKSSENSSDSEDWLAFKVDSSGAVDVNSVLLREDAGRTAQVAITNSANVEGLDATGAFVVHTPDTALPQENQLMLWIATLAGMGLLLIVSIVGCKRRESNSGFDSSPA